ncbi:hypothetical protein I79_025975 [Cricetulus griseus]|uniref:Uncharacterized protein n=1 Tax=Cricetulus griseus TaxID=10029 RepID=G3IPQ6_CRIGR|nr:hypothetical protein I79_025975 [Cricetulus griseus]
MSSKPFWLEACLNSSVRLAWKTKHLKVTTKQKQSSVSKALLTVSHLYNGLETVRSSTS